MKGIEAKEVYQLDFRQNAALVSSSRKEETAVYLEFKHRTLKDKIKLNLSSEKITYVSCQINKDFMVYTYVVTDISGEFIERRIGIITYETHEIITTNDVIDKLPDMKDATGNTVSEDDFIVSHMAAIGVCISNPIATTL
ncbi:hypothetical protein MBAV_002657 [Candidatus Magnetobacterium bavaricum]|uniref:Uncharacterized protein n=1 Tax=Candidatus Magnetobacterium bavaricum TaxID=29290 RepID=A0A0F3GT78_9BACT|nr:hypothetical protein MBAV_002657 [Candidatus Magnetobacterium bavaricum]